MAVHLRFLQANINHCARAQDLLLQSMAQWQINIAIVGEPYFVPPSGGWMQDLTGKVAIISQAAARTPTPENITRGRGCVAAQFGQTVVVGAYFSPNRPLADFEELLREVHAVVTRSHPRPVLFVGDLNAKSPAWGSATTNDRGEMLEEWAIGNGLLLLNRGSEYTCVRRQGASIVDVSFASPALAHRVQGWRVVEEVETNSDHLYIRFDVSAQTSDPPAPRTPIGGSPRWALKQLNREVLLEASIVQAWVSAPVRPDNVDVEAEWFREAMTQICDAAMPRVTSNSIRRRVYWWSDHIAQLRHSCVVARRRHIRLRRRRRRPPDYDAVEAELYEAYRAAKKALQIAIKRAKEQARQELLETLNHNPWGRPYLMVRNKLRQWSPPLTQSLRPDLLQNVVAALFPSRAEFCPPPMVPPSTASNADFDDGVTPEVTRVEMRAAVSRLQAKNTAPGPDGIPGRAWALALEELAPRLMGLLTCCLEEGRFPTIWKVGKLVLIKKEGRPADSPSAYRPIVLLDEVAKMFEFIIAERLVQHLSSAGPDLADNQFGFRRGRSTIDAILRVRSLAEEAVARGEVVLAVSLDIANAFNTLPWSCIREALLYHRVPPYLRRIVGAYLSERSVVYPGHFGWSRREMSCGVPQGSVLGPLLWNIGYDWVLRGALLRGVGVVCYADDTLVTARGKTYQAAAILANIGVAQVVRRIRRMGLEVALSKSEAICFYGPRNRPPSGAHLMVGGVNISVGSSLKYLGIILDSRWTFDDHFRRLAPKLKCSAGALSRLLPNLGGPNSSCRRLYEGVVRSMALYGAPVWANDLTARNIPALRAPQRAMAVRLIRGYRTISFEAASLLAGSAPWDLEARLLASLFIWRGEALARGDDISPRSIEARRSELRQVLVEEWRARLVQPSAGHATVVAVSPVLNEWLERRHGALTYRLTQVLSGHGCFGRFLCRIGRQETPGCYHCGDGRDGVVEDTALHTLAVCPAWASQRRELVAAVGSVVPSLTVLVRYLLRDEGSFNAVASYCEEVMLAKEVAEREREHSNPLRNRRTGRRRARDDLQPP